MTSAPSTSRTGAVRADEPRRRRRGLLWLLALLGLVLLVALGLGLYFGLRGEDKPNPASAAASASASAPAAGAGGPTTSAAGGSAGSAPAGSASAGAGGLVGGGGVVAAPATAGSPLAAAGNVGTVLFAENSAALDAQGQRVVADAAARVRSSGARQVLVGGYTDVVGGQPVNGSLSQQRADRVAAALRQQLGTTVTVRTTARGEADAVAPNDSPANRQLNRRATISTR